MGVLFISILAGCSAAADASAEALGSLRERFAEVNGVQLHYRVGGNGPALVFLHGLTLSGAWWDSLAPHLLADHTVILPDLRGHGRSTNPSGVYRHSEIATDVLQLMDVMGIREFAGIGHSSGAGVFLHMAARAPDRVRSMILIGLGHRVTNATRARWSKAELANQPRRYREYWLRIHPGGTAQVERIIDYLRHLGDVEEELNLPRDMLTRISAQTLIVFGDRDSHPVEIATELYRILPQSQLWIVPHTGYFPVWLEWDGNPAAAGEFPNVVKAFFAVGRQAEKRP